MRLFKSSFREAVQATPYPADASASSLALAPLSAHSTDNSGNHHLQPRTLCPHIHQAHDGSPVRFPHRPTPTPESYTVILVVICPFNDTVTTVHINNLVPVALSDADATDVARISAGEHLVTAVTGHSGSPSNPGTLFFNLQFDHQTTNDYPTRFRNCKFVALVRDYIKELIRVTPNSPFRILLPQLGEDAPQRIRKANRQLSDYEQQSK